MSRKQPPSVQLGTGTTGSAFYIRFLKCSAARDVLHHREGIARSVVSCAS